MRGPARWLVAVLVGLCALLVAGVAAASGTPQLQYVWSCSGNTAGCGGTVVFIHGMDDCSQSMTSCNGGDATTGPVSYWTNDYNNANMLNEATTQYTSSGYMYFEAFSLGYDLNSQGFWSSANDVGNCLDDLFNGTNNSGCNPSQYQRSQVRIVTHSAGATVIDRLLSTGWYGINGHIVGNVVTLAPALTGSKVASYLYGVDGVSPSGPWYCNNPLGHFVSWLVGLTQKNNGAASLTRGAVTGEANKGYAGRSPRWLLKVVTTGGSGSANNSNNTSVSESDNDSNMGMLGCYMGYSSSDDMDGLLYWSDSDPTNNTGGNGCNTSDTAYGGDNSCHYYSQYSGAYWHWFTSWANHSHSRDDAYNTLGDWQTTNGCYTRTPGTCVGQYGL